ncbi:MerR family transcriptional regulator [Nocardia sp. CA-128927]
MRIAELSSRSGVSVRTMTYYLREGLPGHRLEPGVATSARRSR